MTNEAQPDEQGDALTPGAIATMREWGWTEAQIEAQRQEAERIRAAGGFSNWVKMNEAARIASEARGYPVEPESFTVKRYESAADELAEIAGLKDVGMPPDMWAYSFGMEHVERNTGPGYPVLTPSEQCTLRTAVEGQIMRTFEAQADTLPLRQVPSGLQWPKGQPLPPKWREGMYLTKIELRAWAAEHCPDLLGSALLAEPESAPAGEAATVAEQGTPAEQWAAAKGDMKRKHELAKAAEKACQGNRAAAARRLETTTGPLYRALNWAKTNAPESVAPSVASVAPMYRQLAGGPHKT